MSLHTLAHHLQSTGRNGDNMLVHMTSDEVGGLQDLARYMGKSLTINPHTGLPEANIFSQAWKAIKPFAPMIAGAALAPLTAGTSLAFLGTPLAAAGLVGGGTALATGSLEKGLMAGLGAYGGAGLTAGLGSLGATGAVDSAAGLVAAPTTQAIPGSIAAGAPFAPNAAGMVSQATSLTTPAAAAGAGAGVGAGAGTALNPSSWEAIKAGASKLATQPTTAFPELYKALPANTIPTAAATLGAGFAPAPRKLKKDESLIRPYEFTRELTPEATKPIGNVWDGPVSSGEIDYFKDKMTALQPYIAPGPEYNKKNKIAGTYTPMPGMYNPLGQQIDPITGRPINPYTGQPAYAVGGPVEQMSAENAVGGNMMYPQSQFHTPTYSNPAMQRPMPTDIIPQGLNSPVDPYTGEQKFASGGISQLGGYSDGGRLLKGPGDGVSDSIPAVIGNRQPARLADGEFVVPARIVSELGNGSTEAGAKRLYAMMDRVQRARRKTVGKGKVATDTNAEKFLPA